MNKKELRKELELTLAKVIEESLTKINADAAKKISKTTLDASKSIAKKFYKAIKTFSENTTAPIIGNIPTAKNLTSKKDVAKVVKKANQPITAIKSSVKPITKKAVKKTAKQILGKAKQKK